MRVVQHTLRAPVMFLLDDAGLEICWISDIKRFLSPRDSQQSTRLQIEPTSSFFHWLLQLSTSEAKMKTAIALVGLVALAPSALALGKCHFGQKYCGSWLVTHDGKPCGIIDCFLSNPLLIPIRTRLYWEWPSERSPWPQRRSLPTT